MRDVSRATPWLLLSVLLSSRALAGDVLTTYCVSCHGPEKAKADLRVDTLLKTRVDEATLPMWKEILSRLETRDMPPKDKKRPSESEYDTTIARIFADVVKVETVLEAKRPRAMRRLNRSEYANTIRDLFAIDYVPGSDFPADDALHGFDNVAEGLNLSPTLVGKYLATATQVVERAIRIGDKPSLRTQVYAFEDEKHRYADNAKPAGLGVYNGNAHLSFKPANGMARVIYIGGPALFARQHQHSLHRQSGQNEGVWRLNVRMTPRSFPAVEVASFTLLGGDGRLVAERDVRIDAGTKEVVLNVEAYHDRSAEEIGFELQWTNGYYQNWPNRRNPPSKDHYQSNHWFLYNHRLVDGKWQEWKPSVPEESPFPYFENVEFTISGPHHDLWPPASTQSLLGSYLSDGDATKVFARFLPRAFRRAVTATEIERLATLVAAQRAAGLDAVAAMKVGLTAALCSPHFLFLVEVPPATAARGTYQLSGFELATRLSYFLWSSMPDDELRALAVGGTLGDPAVLTKQVARMLANSKSAALTANFARQWLGLDKLASVMPEPKLFPNYSESLRDATRDETLAFFREVVAKNLPITDFLDARWTFLNETLAEHYGLPAVPGRLLQKVDLSDARRGGLLTQAAVLTLTSEATRTAPVLRGTYLLDRIFNRPPPPPPPNVGSLIPDASQAKSVREHLAIHRADIACSGCHARIDPYGLVLENFDAVGAWRTSEAAHADPTKATNHDGVKSLTFPIDAMAELKDGSHMDGIAGLKQHLLARKLDFTRGLAERMSVYALGRGLLISDRGDLDVMVKATATDNFRMQSLIRAVVMSKSFRTR